MRAYTVIGYYESAGEAFSMPATGANQYEAMQQIADKTDDPSDLWIIGAIEGIHSLFTPGEDNTAIACAIDLQTEG